MICITDVDLFFYMHVHVAKYSPSLKIRIIDILV